MAMMAGAGMAGVGMAGQAITSGKAANAAQGMATAQQNQADLAMGFAAPTAGELQNISQQNSIAQQALQYSQAQLKLAGQTVSNAFSQQNAIMNGQIPSYLQPLQNQLKIAAQQNQNRVNGTMGGGSSSSSAGIAANAMFGQSAAMTTMNAQQQALGTLGQVGANANNIGMGSAEAAGNINNQAFGMQNLLQTNQMNAALGTAKYAGSQYAGSLYDNQALGNMFGSMAGIGSGVAMNQAFGPKSLNMAPKQ
jgi:hypothetical protein